VINNSNQGTVTLRGVYSKGAGNVCNNNGDEDLIATGQLDKWSRVKRYNYVTKKSKITYGGPSYLAKHYDAVTGVQSNIAIADQEAVDPPEDLTSKHIWATTPSFEDSDTVLVTEADKIQSAIDANQKVCLAKGIYKLNSPITLKSNTILFGCPGFGAAGAILKYGWTPSAQTWLIGTENNAEATTYMMDITTDPENANFLGSLHWQAGKNSIIRNVWFNKSWNQYEQNLIRFYISGNGGGRIFNYQDEKGSTPNSTSFRKVKISGTSQLLTFYGLNLERGGNKYPESAFPMLEIEKSSHIRIFGAKTETSQPYALINNSDDIFMTNIIDFAHFGEVAKNYIEIINSSSDHIEITNVMFLKSPNASFFNVADPWNINEVPRTMTLGCYHHNWSSISDEILPPLSIDKFHRSFGLYPNPATRDLNIKYSGIFENEVVQISNISGQIIREFRVSPSNQKISIESIPSGIYFVHLKGIRNITTKLIKQ